MRNLKKILALVLALVMSISVMTIASADFKDADKVNTKFETAVNVLSGLGVFQGYEDGTFNPTGAITRAEVAAIIYRIDTGDVDDEQVAIYADYNKFDDVKSTAWYAGYVNYCANALYIKGYDETTFGPNDKVTGYQALAMILRVVGYDKNGEFSGSAWQIETAKYANALGITKNVNANTLGVAATRELVAELLFQTIWTVPTVTYTLLQGYNQYQETFAKETLNPTLAERTFDLAFYKNVEIDMWGRPGDQWTAYNDNMLVHEVPYAPLYETVKAETECSVATGAGLKKNTSFQYWLNGAVALTEKLDKDGNIVRDEDNEIVYIVNPAAITVHPTATTAPMGAQGTILEVYKDRIIEIETYLAKVTDNTKATYDKAGHQITPAKDHFDVYGFNGAVLSTTLSGNNYAKGDYLLVYYYAPAAKIIPYAAPTMFDAKQEVLWWNASQHVIAGTKYPDHVYLYLNDAGYDNTKEYTWFLDSYNNVIGSANIVKAEDPANYAVVLGARWVNTGAFGEYGYAQGLVQFLDGSAAVSATLAGIYAYVKDENGNLVPADVDSKGNHIPTEFNYVRTNNPIFSLGEVTTTYQYNNQTAMHLYEVTETTAGLVLTEVCELNGNGKHYAYTPAVDENTPAVTYQFVKGYSQIMTSAGAPTGVYTDNYTKFFYVDATTGALTCVEGYAKMANYTINYMDVVTNEYGFAQYIYMIGAFTKDAAAPVYSVEQYVFFTADVLSLYEAKDHFTVYGVNGAGEIVALRFAKGADDAATEAIRLDLIDKMQNEWVNKLYLVETKSSVVIDMVEVTAAGQTYPDAYGYPVNAKVVTTYTAVEGNGVLLDKDTGEAYNVNETTVVINEDGVGTLADMTVVAGSTVYIVYDAYNFVSAIFVKP